MSLELTFDGILGVPFAISPSQVTEVRMSFYVEVDSPIELATIEDERTCGPRADHCSFFSIFGKHDDDLK